jgi:tetratricopeptide (TPR) repeat protein
MNGPPLRVLTAGLVLAAVLARPVYAQDEADAAWDRGDVEVAERLYERRVAADSSDQRALHRLALLWAWNERYAESVVLFDRLLTIAPENAEAEVDRARVIAWRGDLRQAIADLDGLLVRRPTYVPALQARAQFASWAGELDTAINTYDQLVEITPEDRSVRYARARTLGWAARFDDAIAEYDSLLRTDPYDREARFGLARILSWSNVLDSATALYRVMVQTDSADLDAWRGLAQTLTWSGSLLAGERAWRRTLKLAPEDVPALVGLAQTLRWQGRDAAALEILQRAERIDPTYRDLRTQLQWARAATAPRVGSSFVYESDSDGNRIGTLAARAAFRPVPRVEVRVEGYTRDLDQVGDTPLERTTRGGSVEFWTQFEPGWSVAVGAGVSDADTDGAESVARFTASVSTPGRYRAGGTVRYTRSALDVTALLAERGVDYGEVSLALRGEPAAGWSVTGGISRATFDGTESNRRVAGSVGASRRVARAWTFGMSWRGFGYEKNLSDGYFDPEFYSLTEMTGRWQREIKRWTVVVEAAPGVQTVTGADLSASARVRGVVGFRFAPGREVAAAAGFSSTGLQVFSSEVGTYRYRTLSLSGSWAF